MTNKSRIEHNKPDCIGCAVCAALSEKFWEMDKEKKSHLKNSSLLEDKGWETLEIEDGDLEINKECAEACPVNVIHIRDKKGNLII